MKTNIKDLVETSLKTFLKKKKIGFTTGLLVAFLITGEIGFATNGQTEELESKSNNIQQELFDKIFYQRLEVEELLKANEEKLKELTIGYMDLIKEGDWYSKSRSPSYFYSIIGDYKSVDRVNKKWVGSTRSNTVMDMQREAFNRALGGGSIAKSAKYLPFDAGRYTNDRYGGNLSSGWVNSQPDYNTNTVIYDYEDSLIILPIVKAPEVLEPTAPAVTFVAPTAPTVVPVTSPQIANILVGTISLTTPNINPLTVNIPASFTQPAAVNVTVNEPNINVTINDINVAGPGALVIPTLTSPSISITLSPNVPPSVQDPNPVVSTPVAPPEPNFTAFTRGRGDWLGGFKFIQGRNNWDRTIMAWEQGSPEPVLRAINSQPMFNINGTPTIYGLGKSSTSKIVATTFGSTVTNSYTDIASNVTVGGGAPNNQYGAHPLTETSPGVIPGMTAGAYYSAIDNQALPTVLPAGISGSSNPNSTRYQQSWIFEGTPTVQDMAIKVGGDSPSASTAIFAQISRIVMNNVAIELAGRTVIGQLSTRDAYTVNFNNVDINITGNSNSILTSYLTPNQHVYYQSTDGRTSTIWGRSFLDNVASTSYVNLGGTNLVASTSENTIFYFAPASQHRWTGTSQMVPLPNTSTPLVYDLNSEKYYIYSPLMGNMRIENNGGSIAYTGSGNVGIWVAAYIPDRSKWMAAGTFVSPSLNLGDVSLQGDQNVGYYFAGNNSRADANGIFQGNVYVNAKLGTMLDNSSGTIQIGTGNKGGNDAGKSEDNVAIYVASGQRTGLNNNLSGFLQYFPATLGFLVNTTLHPNLVGLANGSEIGFPYLTADPIKDMNISNFAIEFGKYSKRGIGLISKNGSAVNVDVTGTEINDNAGTAADRAVESIMFYAEGIWHNPRRALTGGVYNQEAYGRGESTTGQKNISDFNSTINVVDNITMSSLNAIALFAKNGGKITGQNITMNGYSSKGVFAYGVGNHSNLVDS
ncbi:MAG: autotransporter-associated N-terminal domain-containing protein, partial [Fusobacteriaceae bacterium]|nr:autotransporter-associated N-terminal domain-containing protein [Fusobacteriaceae bacterium]